MAATLFTNVQIFDGTVSGLFPGQVLVEGNRIKAVAKGSAAIPANGAEVIDGGGATLTPGLVESHAHLFFGSSVDRIERRQDVPSEAKLMRAVHAAKTLLDYGFTSAYSAGSGNAVGEVAIREEIANGYLPGPRLKACSFERNAAAAGPSGHGGGTGMFPGIKHREPDVAGTRQFVKDMAAIGCDSVKFVISGESGIHPGTSREIQFYDEEMMAAGEAARESNVWLNAHTHSADSVKLAIKAGFRVLYHGTWSDEEAFEMMVANKDKIFLGPAPGINWANIHEGAAFGITKEVAEAQEQFETLERVMALMPRLHKAGVRILIGGDYGFPWNPNGKNGRDLELFVNLFQYTPAEAWNAGTQLGGQIMDMGDELGLIKEGYLADMLLLDGDPLKNIKLVQDKNNILMVMKDGKFHKKPDARREQHRVAAE